LKKLVIGCVIIFLLVGVHLNNQRLAEARQRTLRVWVDREEYDLLRSLNSVFEQQHDAVIEMEIVPSEQVLAKLPLHLGAVDYPDIINVSHTLITELVGNQLLTPITAVFEEFNILPAVYPAFKVMDDYYGIPYHAQTDILFYDSEQFPEGIAPLAMTENVEEISLVLDYQGIYHSLPYVTGFGGYMVGLDNFGDINFYDIGLNTEASIEGLKLMVEILDSSIIGRTEASIYEAFVHGNANVLIASAAILESLQEAMPHVGFQSIPNFTMNNIPYTYMRLDTYQLTKDVSNEALATQYLHFLLSDRVATARYQLNRSIAPINHENINTLDPFYSVIRTQLHRSLPLPNQVEFNYLYNPYRQAANRFVENPDQMEEILDEAVREIDNKLTNLLR